MKKKPKSQARRQKLRRYCAPTITSEPIFSALSQGTCVKNAVPACDDMAGMVPQS